jgi:choline dehydrogenase-like flavoprotein
LILSANDVDRSALAADIVIIGGGAAGITLARHFAGRHSKQVILLESGGVSLDASVQELYSGTLAGVRADPPLDASRLRLWGGTTNHWMGWCRPLEASDFERRRDWPESGWPISRRDVEPYYRQAADICQLGTVEFESAEFWRNKPGGRKVSLLPLDPNRLQTAIFQVSPPVRFGTAYGRELGRADNVRVVLHCNVMELLPAEGHHPDQAIKRLKSVRVQSPAGKSFTVSARAFVVAAGGIESARLLLLSDRVHPNGAGNEHDLVGRYFMDHPWLNANCYVRFSQPHIDLSFYFDQMKLAGARLFGTVVPTAALCEKEGIGKFRLWLNRATGSDAGVNSAHEVAHSLKQGKLPTNFLAHLGSMISDIDVLADAAYKTVFRTNKGWLSADKSAPSSGAWVDLNFEQRPNPSSRVQLGNDRDRLGQRRVLVTWALSDTDRRTAMRALEIAAQEFGRIGLGRARIDFDLAHDASWPSNMISSCHHSGTTRMSDTPTSGVVNADSRVHSVDNLYVAGSAVFPTTGYANPTLTIVALAARLADHLDRVLS